MDGGGMIRIMKHNPKLSPYARQLRKNMTKEESELWYKYLRKYPYQFRRQVTVGKYILDFYCASAKLCIELDGQSHYTFHGAREDDIRTQFLNSKGIRVIRFENRLIWDNLQGVLDIIKAELENEVIENKEY